MTNETRLTRRSFLKGASALGLSAALAALHASPVRADERADEASEAVYVPGTYTATARGMESDVTVTITVDETSILEAIVATDGETESIGRPAGPRLADQILEAQGQDIDGVTGATVTSDAVRKACESCIAQAKGIDVSLLAAEEEEGPADWLGEEPEIAEEDITGTIECDVLVVGAGSSGLFAAASAVENGAKTILIEKFGHDMASGIRDTFAGVGSSQQKEDGYDVDPNEYVRYVRDWSQGYASEALARVFVQNSGELIDWYTDVLKQGGMDFLHEYDEHDLPANYKGLEVGHSVQYTDEYYEQLTMDKVLDYCVPLGLASV